MVKRVNNHLALTLDERKNIKKKNKLDEKMKEQEKMQDDDKKEGDKIKPSSAAQQVQSSKVNYAGHVDEKGRKYQKTYDK